MPPVKMNELGPNYAGYYKHKISELLSGNEDPFAHSRNQDSNSFANIPSMKTRTEDLGNAFRNVGDSLCDGSLPLFSDGIGAGLSSFQKDRLQSLLVQCVDQINQEVDEMLPHVYQVSAFQESLKGASASSSSSTAEQEGNSISNMQKMPSSPNSKSAGKWDIIDHHLSYGPENPEKQGPVEISGVKSDENVKSHSSALLSKLGQMEQQLEELLNVVMSCCRPMFFDEKVELCHRIRKLPCDNLYRLIEILRPKKASTESDDIQVDLEMEDNATLWRLHFYTEMVTKSRKIH
ncbi:uncharacterized protein LOC18438711 [Amborella trichopoda]|uniref:NET domain-containing protein n=1 Tax=Amborella trichopoda TaxID=13333 RepID=W1PTC6_AMBTC|nr:uncharacterized protein LOC18438711 [Amborella trichopoda]XP_020525774.1 uncharacterized protein LOC18438711 [Amborella trichopoda]ERN10540.1 hypothetical protein AMTR_s00166p00064660 [Amborella trichopoda]|eukprot:XP_006848959.1 uncharacterized protein LOC18438711 [Amborella trichopoda]